MDFIKKEPIIYIVFGKARSGKSTVSNLIREHYNSIGLKTLNLGYSDKLKNYIKNITDWDGNELTKPRTLLQQLGTDLIRNQIDEMFFVNNLMDDIKVYSHFFDVITISDARFINELETPKERFKNVKIIKIVNPNIISDLTKEEQKHITETELDNYEKYDYEIINDKDLENLKLKVEQIMKEVD